MRSPDSSAGARATQRQPRTSLLRMFWSIRCAGDFTRGRGFASTCSTSPPPSGRRRKLSIRTSARTIGATSAPLTRGAEHVLELVSRRDLELIVAAVGRLLVGPPPQEDRRVSKALPLHMVVLDLAHAFDPQRFPR